MKYTKYIASLLCCMFFCCSTTFCFAQTLDDLEKNLSGKKATSVKIQTTSSSKDFWENFVESPEDREISIYIWGMPSYTFGLSLGGMVTDYLHLGLGFEANPLRDKEKTDGIATLLGQAAFSIKYLSFGTLLGFGGNSKDRITETIHGVFVETQADETKFHLLAAPYVEARIPVSKVYLCLLAGYNFYLINGGAHNGLRLGLGISFEN